MIGETSTHAYIIEQDIEMSFTGFRSIITNLKVDGVRTGKDAMEMKDKFMSYYQQGKMVVKDYLRPIFVAAEDETRMPFPFTRYRILSTTSS